MTNNIDYTSILINFTANRNCDTTLKAMNLIDNEHNRDILNSFLNDWDRAECDEEGATQEQDDNLNTIIDKTIDRLLII